MKYFAVQQQINWNVQLNVLTLLCPFLFLMSWKAFSSGLHHGCTTIVLTKKAHHCDPLILTLSGQ